ncbi:hypothetical protein GBAR_LOCUS12541, partial [Geodia barretti]
MTSLTSLTFPHLYKQVGTADKHQTMEVMVRHISHSKFLT